MSWPPFAIHRPVDRAARLREPLYLLLLLTSIASLWTYAGKDDPRDAFQPPLPGVPTLLASAEAGPAPVVLADSRSGATFRSP